MDNRQIALKLICDNLGIEFQMNTFVDRLILQKSVYLIQSSGINLGYFFSWYLRGPYNSNLATDGFSIQDELATGCDESKKWKLDESISGKLSSIRDLFQAEGGNKELLANNLELFASVHFLIKRKNIDSNDTNKLVSTLAKYNKHFDHSQVKWATKELSGHGVLN